jgi:hypothetical protein
MLAAARSSSFHVSIRLSLGQNVQGLDNDLIAAAASFHAISIHELLGKDIGGRTTMLFAATSATSLRISICRSFG